MFPHTRTRRFKSFIGNRSRRNHGGKGCGTKSGATALDRGKADGTGQKQNFARLTSMTCTFLIADVAGCRALGSLPPRPVPNSGRIEAPCALIKDFALAPAPW